MAEFTLRGEERVRRAVVDYERQAREALAVGKLPPPRPAVVRTWVRRELR